MSNINDLFVSYKRVEEPTITVPKYTPEAVPETMIRQGNLATRVQRVKERLQDKTPFTWKSGGAKEAPYTIQQPSQQQPVQQSGQQPIQQDSSFKAPTGNSWKSQMFAAYKRAGCSDQYARNLTGQDALETGWGKHIVGDFNYGNIKTGKSWSGRSKRAHDKREGSNDAYRSYTSIDDYVQDKLRLLRDRYGMVGNESAEQFTDKLVAGGYATAKDYKQQVLKVIKSV